MPATQKAPELEGAAPQGVAAAPVAVPLEVAAVGVKVPVDPLTECLRFLVKHHGRDLTSETLVAGLPLEQGKRLSPPVLLRAAERIGFASRVVQRPIQAISHLLLPCILLLKDNHACVMVRRQDDDSLVVMWPDAGGGATAVPLKEIEGRYLGYAALIQPVPEADALLGHRYVGKGRTSDWFWGVLSKYWRLYAEVGLATLLTNVFALAGTIFTLNVYDRILPNQAEHTLWVLALGVGTVYVFDAAIRMIRGHLLSEAGTRADAVMASTIFAHVMGLRLLDRPKNSGQLASALREFETLRDFFSSVTLSFLLDLPFSLFVMWVLYMLCGPVAIVPLVAAPLLIAAGFLAQGPMQKAVKMEMEQGYEKFALLSEALMNHDTIKAIGAEGFFQREWERNVEATSEAAATGRKWSTISIYTASLVQQLATTGVMIVGFYQSLVGQLTLGGLIAASILTGKALAPMGQVASLFSRYHRSKLALARLDELMALPAERDPGRSYLSRPMIRGAVEFEGVNFTYPDRKLPALEKVSFKIKAGEHVGILGRMGSGKSTLFKLILGLYPPTEGVVLVDGTDSDQIDPAELRSHVSYLPQEPLLLSGTIRQNLAAAAPRGLDEDSLRRALEISGLMNLVARNPQGLDMPVGEGGRALSGGQRQVVGLARALIRDASILLLDEPTSSLDSTAEAAVIGQLEGYAKGRTLLLSTHKIPLLQLVDRLIILDEGKIVADGPKAQVLDALRRNSMGQGGAP